MDLGRRTRSAILYGAIVLGAILLPPIFFYALVAFALSLALVELRELIPPAGRTERALGTAYLTVCFVALAWLRALGPEWVLIAALPIWAADVAAYAVGSRFGRERIAPRVSPGKTVEGTFAGIAAALVVGFATCVLVGASALVTFAVPLLIGVVGFGGDLLESWVKRVAGVKDSGALMPGHGGILDRLDSLLPAAVLVALISAVR